MVESANALERPCHSFKEPNKKLDLIFGDTVLLRFSPFLLQKWLSDRIKVTIVSVVGGALGGSLGVQGPHVLTLAFLLGD